MASNASAVRGADIGIGPSIFEASIYAPSQSILSLPTPISKRRGVERRGPVNKDMPLLESFEKATRSYIVAHRLEGEHMALGPVMLDINPDELKAKCREVNESALATIRDEITRHDGNGISDLIEKLQAWEVNVAAFLNQIDSDGHTVLDLALKQDLDTKTVIAPLIEAGALELSELIYAKSKELMRFAEEERQDIKCPVQPHLVIKDRLRLRA